MVYDSLDAKLHIILDNAKISRRFLVQISCVHIESLEIHDCNLADIVCQIAIIECTKPDISSPENYELCTMN